MWGEIWHRLCFWRKPFGWKNLATGEERKFRTQEELFEFLMWEDDDE